jgi:hypothetical protein
LVLETENRLGLVGDLLMLPVSASLSSLSLGIRDGPVDASTPDRLPRDKATSKRGFPVAGKPPRVAHGLVLAFVAVAASLAVASRLDAQGDEPPEINREYAIKAAYLYQFGRYVQWPDQTFADKDSPLVIGVLGTDPFGGVLEEIAHTKRIEGRPILVKHFNSMSEYTPCHILFVTASAGQEQAAAAIQKAQKTHLLLVGEEPEFARNGGTMNFFLDENKVRFEVNTDVAKQEQLRISSKLLSLAKIVPRR